MNMTWLGQLPTLARHIAADDDLRGWIATKWKTLEPATLITAESARTRGRNVVVIAPSTPQEFAVVRSYITVKGVLSAVLMRGPKVWELQVDGETVTVTELERSWD